MKKSYKIKYPALLIKDALKSFAYSVSRFFKQLPKRIVEEVWRLFQSSCHLNSCSCMMKRLGVTTNGEQPPLVQGVTSEQS